MQANNNIVYTVEDLQTGSRDDVQASRLKLYHDASLDTAVVMAHVLGSGTGRVVSRLLRIGEREDGLYIVVRWKGLSESEDTTEPVRRVYEDVPGLVLRLLNRKNNAPLLAEKFRSIFAL